MPVSKGVSKPSSGASSLVPENAALVGETADVPFTAEGRLLSGSLYISGGTLRIPQEVKEVNSRSSPNVLPVLFRGISLLVCAANVFNMA